MSSTSSEAEPSPGADRVLERLLFRPLAPGLPLCLSEEIRQLNDYLGLNRRDRRFIAGLVPHDIRADLAEQLREEKADTPGELTQYLMHWFYRSPRRRRRLWRERLRQDPDALPSVEYEALKALIRDMPGERASTTQIAETARDRSSKALARWNALGEEERKACVLQTFAAATLLRDARVLDDAVSEVSELREEFFFQYLEEEEAGDRGPPTPAERWRTICQAVASTLDRAAGPPPRVSMLDLIRQGLEALEELEVEVRAELDGPAFDELFGVVKAKLDEVQANPALPLGDRERKAIEEQWRAWRPELCYDDAQLHEWALHFRVDKGSESVRLAAEEYAAAKGLLDAHRADEPSSPLGSAATAWNEQLEALRADENERRDDLRRAWRELLEACRPPEQEPDHPDSRPSPEKNAADAADSASAPAPAPPSEDP